MTTRSDQPTTPTVLVSAAPRKALWGLLLVLIAALLALLVWLAMRYEVAQMQTAVEQESTEAVTTLRAELARDLQNLQVLQVLQAMKPSVGAWTQEGQTMLVSNPEWLRLEWRDAQFAPIAWADSSLRPSFFSRIPRQEVLTEVRASCDKAARTQAPSYSATYFLPSLSGLGQEVMELCLPQVQAGKTIGYTILVYGLQDLLAQVLGPSHGRNSELAFTEADGTRLAIHGYASRGSRVFVGQQLLDLPGSTLVLRIDQRRGAPELFPNLLTALVVAMTLSLLLVLWMLGRDTRKRLRAERGLADALALRNAMENSLVTGLRARDLAGRITYVNPAFCDMVGFSAQELMGVAAPLPFWPPEMVEEYQRRQAVRFSGASPPRDGYESVFMRKDGHRFPVLIFEAPLINASGIHTGWMGACLDISEQRRIEELSRASQERLQATARLATVGEMASLLSHELNQPLAAISSYATGSINLLTQSPQGQVQMDDLHAALQGIATQAERAGRVIKSVHDFVRRRDQSRRTVDVADVVQAILPLLRLQAQKLLVQLDLRLAPELPRLTCDPTMLEQVLLNLARNGMQAMAKTPVGARVLRIEVALDGVSLRFAVQDCGSGISAEVAEQLFTPFFTTKPEGMGLGLSLCRTVIEQHGGQLRFETPAEGGTRFYFSLPLQRPTESGDPIDPFHGSAAHPALET
jgi:two-component system, LuxR family, sensor histidine kinase DctS